MQVQDLIYQTKELVEQAEDAEAIRENYLGSALSKALEVLNNKYSAGGSFEVPVQGAEQYADIFSQISENFSDFFREMSSMRSSFLPYSLVQDIPLEDDAVTFAELTSAESIRESFENTFFRMLGMPSSSDLAETDPLFSITPSGEPRTISRWLTKEEGTSRGYEGKILNARQVERMSRPDSPGSELYNFLTSVNIPEALDNVGFILFDELIECLDLLRVLYNLDDLASEDAKAAAEEFDEAVASFSVTEEEVGDSTGQLVKQAAEQIAAFVSGFGPSDAASDDDSESQPISPNTDNFREIVDKVIFLLDPASSRAINSSLKRLITNYYVLEVDEPSLLNIHEKKNFWRFSRLLFPPIQDGRIGSCINEPSKLVAEPFLPHSMRRVNGRTMRSTLLEAVIRIRLDAIAGTTKLSPDDFSQVSAPFGSSDKNISYNQIKNNYGVIESLLIVRLFNSVSGFGIDVRRKINSMQATQGITGIAPTAPEDDLTPAGPPDEVALTPEEERLNTIKSIDDSILFLLGENGPNKAIDYQLGVARNSGLQDAHLMGALTSIIRVPGMWADKKLSDILERREAPGRPADTSRSDVDNKLGVARGVGVIDVVAFLIALFSVSEATLIGLLNSRQKEYMKLEFPSGFFDSFFEGDDGKIAMRTAVNDVAQAAYDAYELFRFYISRENESVGLFIFNDYGDGE